MHREPTMECGGVIKGEVPPNRGGVSQYTLSRKQPPTTCNAPKTMQEQRAWGPMGGVYTPGGHTNIWGVYKCMGHTNVGVSNHLP